MLNLQNSIKQSIYCDMTTLRIERVGQVGKAIFKLKRFNFFIGRQSSGKSTIAEIVSFCTWLEQGGANPSRTSRVMDRWLGLRVLLANLYLNSKDYVCMRICFQDNSI